MPDGALIVCVSDHWGRWGRLAALALVGAVLLAGCGGGSSSTTSTTTLVVRGKPKAAKPTARKQRVKKEQRVEKQAPAKKQTPGQSPPRKSRKTSKQGSAEPSATTAPTKAAPSDTSVAPPSRNSLGDASTVEVRKLRKHCPQGVGSSTCTALVEAYVAAQGAESQPLTSAEGCTATRSRAECEKVLQEQSEASEGESLNVQECLANMTPQCEAALRPMFESQQAARGGGG